MCTFDHPYLFSKILAVATSSPPTAIARLKVIKIHEHITIRWAEATSPSPETTSRGRLGDAMTTTSVVRGKHTEPIISMRHKAMCNPPIAYTDEEYPYTLETTPFTAEPAMGPKPTPLVK
mmetsp:Transcript_45965/g.95625  ORF Transcript_45965/g.95625 Transcript_45965/m.95625 type:complete len:120 (+) Transcript_45965:339-698(+)